MDATQTLVEENIKDSANSTQTVTIRIPSDATEMLIRFNEYQFQSASFAGGNGLSYKTIGEPLQLQNGAWSGSFPKQELGTYYVEETNLTGDDKNNYKVTYEVDDGESFDEDALASHTITTTGSHTVKVTNTAEKAKVRVRKEFVDAAGNPITYSEAHAGNSSFSLRRYKRTDSGSITVNVYTPDNSPDPAFTHSCNDGDQLDLYWTGKDGHAGDEFTFYSNSSHNDETPIRVAGYVENGSQYGAYDWDDSADGVRMRLSVTNNSITLKKPNDNDGPTLSSYSGNVINLYVDQPKSEWSDGQNVYQGLDTKTIDGTIHMECVPVPDNTYGTSGVGQTRELSWPSYSDTIWTPNNDNTALEAEFPTAVDLKDTNTNESYIYYVQESPLESSGYATSYSVGGKDVDPGPYDGWLKTSGTVTVTNKDLERTSLKVHKEWTDTATGNAAERHANDTVTYTLYRVTGTPSVTADANSGLVKPSGAEQVTSAMVTGIQNPVTVGKDDNNWSYIWSGLPTSDGSSNKYYYYVEETDRSNGAANTRPRYSKYVYLDDDDANRVNTGVAEVTVSNEETSVAVEKIWKNGDTVTTGEHASDTVTLELYRLATSRGVVPMVDVQSGTNVVMPTGVTLVSDSGITNPVTLSNESNGWTYSWTGLPVGDATNDYTYFVKETQPDSAAESAAYEYKYVDSEKGAVSGVKSATVINRETSVTVQKRWEDAVTGANTTASHTGKAVKVKLLYTTDPSTLTEDVPTGAVLPSELHEVTGDIVSGVESPIELDGDVDANETTAWTYTWNQLPSRIGAEDVYYYVQEVLSENNNGNNPLASYTYTFNTADDEGSGVKKAVITNKETNVFVTKDWMKTNSSGTGEENVNLEHRGQTVTLELWRALKERGASTGDVRIANDSITGLAFPVDGSGAYASYERYDTQVVRFDMGGLNWNYRWTNLPLVVVNGDKVYDAIYFVRESANSESAVSATYETTYNNESFTGGANRSANEAVWMTTGVRSVAITNHETSVEATKTWENGGHTGATVTLDLWKAAKAPSGTTGEWSIVDDPTANTDMNSAEKFAFPQNVGSGGGYVAAQRVDRKTVKYGTDTENHLNEWYAKWDHLPTHESFNGATYELVYFVREAYVTEGGVQYPASATYTPMYNTPGQKDSGVKSVAIVNHDTSVTAQKEWKDQDGNDVGSRHQMNANNDPDGPDKVTYELWKAHVHHGGDYAVDSSSDLSHLMLPAKVISGQGEFDEPLLVDTQETSYDPNHQDDAWKYVWNNLPLYEVVDGVTYKNAYFVREKSVYVDNGNYNPSPTYGYGELTNIGTSGVNGGTVTVTNHETKISVEKQWEQFDGSTSGFTATFRIYRARKALAGETPMYKVDTEDNTHMQFPVKDSTNAATLLGYESFREDKTITSDGNSSTNDETMWDNLPLYETDPVTGKTYELQYFVREIETKSGDAKTEPTYTYTNYTTSGSSYSGLQKVTVKNTETNQKSVSVQKYWTGGNTGHQGVDVKLQSTTAAVPEESNWQDIAGKNVTLEDGNNWKYTWDGLPAKDGDNYIHYRVVEDTTGRTDFEHAGIVNGSNYPRIEASKQDWEDNQQHATYYFDITNKPLYYGKLKLSKSFSLEKTRASNSGDEAEFNAAVADTDDDVTKNNDLQFEITTTDTRIEEHVIRAYEDENGQYVDEGGKKYSIKEERELVRTTWYLVRDSQSASKLVWVSKPVQNYPRGTRKTDSTIITLNGTPVAVAVDETDEEYEARLASEWESKFEGSNPQYTYLKYADSEFAGGEFQIKDSTNHYGTYSVSDNNSLSDHLHADRTYNVREINPTSIDSLEERYTLVPEASTTSGSEAPPYGASGLKSAVGESTIALSNTYRKVTGTISVTKDVTINGGQKYDDVASGKTFKIGLEKWDGKDWVPLYREVTRTTEVRLPNGGTSTYTTTSEEAWVETVTIGSGSTATATFSGLELGRYRAYEVADNGMTMVQDQDEAGKQGGVGLPVSGYQWEVTQTGTYYTYDTPDGGTKPELRMVDGTGTYYKVDGDWVKVDTGAVSVTGASADTDVTLSAGTEDEKSPRNAELTITNNKTETGSITVNKTLFYNNQPDKTKARQTVRFGLYTDSDAAAAHAVDSDPSVDGIQPYIVTAALDGNGKASAKFSGLAYDTVTNAGTANETRTPNKYYVFELENKGNAETPNWQPIKTATAVFDFGEGKKTYTVVGDNKAKVLDHEHREQTAAFTNSIKELGSIKVTKQVYQTDGTTLATDAAGKTFRVGLFTKNDKGTPADTTDDTYVLYNNRVLTVTIGQDSDGKALASNANSTGEATFANLEFDNNPTYYVFEVDNKNAPIIPVAGNEASDKLGDDYVASYPHAGATTGFQLTQAQHVFTATYSTESGAVNSTAGAVVKNTRLVTSASFKIVKVDKQAYASATTPEQKAAAKKLSGAKFTLKRLNALAALVNGEPVYETVGNTQTLAFNQEYGPSNDAGVVNIADVPGGLYEVTETASPTGYLVVGQSTFYIKIDGGRATLLHKGTGVPNMWSAATTTDLYSNTNTDCNLMEYKVAIAGATSTDAQITVGNVAGPELPSTGGPGLWPLLFAGVVFIIASAAALLFERSRA